MAKASVVITADNKIKKGLDPAKKSLLEFQTYVDGIQKKLSKAFSIAGVVTATAASIRSLTVAGKQCVKEYSAAEKVFKRLDAVWANVGRTTGKTYDEIMAYSDAIEKTTYFTGEAVEEAALLLAATESLTEDGFQRALDASVDLAAALGTDVTSAAETLSKAIQEPETALSRLKAIGVAFTEDEKAQIQALTDANRLYEAQSLILDKVERKYKNVAKAINATPAGLINNINDVLGDIRENLGGALLDAISPALESIYGWLTEISGWIAEWRESMTAEQRQLEAFNSLNAVYSKGSITSFEDYDAVSKGIGVFNSVWSNIQKQFGADSAMSGMYKEYADNLESMIDEYVAGIESAYLDLYNNGVITTQDQYDKLVQYGQIDSSVAEILKPYLEDWVKAFLPTDEELRKAEDSAAINAIIDKYSSLSPAKQAADLEARLEDLWSRYLKAEEYGMGQESAYLKEIIDNTQGQLDSLRFIARPDFIESATKELASLINPYGSTGTTYSLFGKDMFSADEKQASAAASSLMSNALEGLGEAGQAAQTLASNMASMGHELGAIVTAINYVVDGFMEVAGAALGEPVMLVVDLLKEVGRSIGSLLLPILKTITPVLKLLIQPLLVLTGTLNYVGQALSHWVSSFFNFLADIHIGTWYPFSGARMSDPGRPGNYGEYLGNYISDYNVNSTATDSAATNTAISSASFRGATQVTINIYQMSPVVGDSGMREFAQMIRDEFDALDYYGVSA